MSIQLLLKEDALAQLEPSFIRENSEFANAYRNINWQDINTLNAVLKAVDHLLKIYSTPNDQIKGSIELIFKQILSRYPLLFGYWKKFTAIQYQLHDLPTSLKVLKNATDSFPYSIDLWCDYLRVLTVNYPKETELIKNKIDKAKQLIGWQFYSHPLWDLIITYYSKNNEDLIPLYYEIIRIPLHQYAKYIGAFKKLLTEKNLQTDIKQVDVLAKENQAAVNQIWPFESSIKQHYFNLTPLSSTEIDNWTKYLNYLIRNNKNSSLLESVFERSLIPCCFVESIWILYVEWNESKIKSKDLTDLSNLIRLYERGCGVIPANLKEFRFKYIQFLRDMYSKFEKSGKTLLFVSFSRHLKNLFEIWPNKRDQNKLMESYLRMLKRAKFYSSIDMSDKEILSKQTEYSKHLDTSINNFIANEVNHSVPLEDMISELNIAIVVVELIKVTWLILKNNLQTRRYLNIFSKHTMLRSSASFWLIYYKFEKSNKNFIKLNKFINELGTEIFLPTSVINDIIDDYKGFYILNSNVIEYQSSKTFPSNYHATEITPVIDPILDIEFKRNDPTWSHNISKNRRINKLEWYKSSLFKENGHPGISIDRPQITNSIIVRSSKSFRNIPPDLPTFRNLEKINQPGTYKDCYSEEFLNFKK